MIPLNYVLNKSKHPPRNIETKKCQEILDNYGVPVGYSCIYQQIRILPEHEMPHFFRNIDQDLGEISILKVPEIPNIDTISDDLYERLFNEINYPPSQKKRNTKKFVPSKVSKKTRRRK